MKISVVIDDTSYACNSRSPWDHNGKSCPIHELESSPAYAPTLGRNVTPELVNQAVRAQIQGKQLLMVHEGAFLSPDAAQLILNLLDESDPYNVNLDPDDTLSSTEIEGLRILCSQTIIERQISEPERYT